MNRIDRVTAILIQLQSKRVVKAQEVAERFDISLRTVYRDIRTLEEAGIPVVGEAGIGYSLLAGYRLPPVMFTREEATSFLVAEKILEKYTDKDNIEKFRSALYKVKAVLKSSEKQYLEVAEDNITVLKSRHVLTATNNSNLSLQKILHAINEKVVMNILYRNAYATIPIERSIEPIGTFLQNSHWYLIAFCHLKKDYRNFRMDRLENMVFTDEKITRTHPSLKEYIERNQTEENLFTIIISVNKLTAKYITTEKFYYGFVSEKDNVEMVEMTFLYCCLQAFCRWFLTIASDACIIEPEELKVHLRTLVKNIIDRS